MHQAIDDSQFEAMREFDDWDWSDEDHDEWHNHSSWGRWVALIGVLWLVGRGHRRSARSH